MNEMIQTKDLCFEYQGEEQNTQVLKQMNLSIRKGEFIAVLGHNGSGKSTLAKHFNSILIPTSEVQVLCGGDIDTSGGRIACLTCVSGLAWYFKIQITRL